MKCGYPECDVAAKQLLMTIDDGKERVHLCPNHSIALLLQKGDTSNLAKEPSQLSEVPVCDICGKEGGVVQDGNDTMHLCHEHRLKLLALDLSPDEFFVMMKKYPNAYLLHDDFYIPETGESVQPREIDYL